MLNARKLNIRFTISILHHFKVTTFMCPTYYLSSEQKWLTLLSWQSVVISTYLFSNDRNIIQVYDAESEGNSESESERENERVI